MIRRKNHLLETALACVERGIPVQPATPEGNPERPGWLTDANSVGAVWRVAEPPNLTVTSSATLAIWKLPKFAGAYGKRLYEQQRPSIWPPSMQLSDGQWITCTLPPDNEVGPLATGVEYIAPGTPVMISPSRDLSGRQLHWDGSKFPEHPLPSAHAVLSQVLRAEIEYPEVPSGPAR
jgi:hypothetical protein